MVTTAVVDVDDESHVARYTALPSPQYASDHISLVAHFEWLEDSSF